MDKKVSELTATTTLEDGDGLYLVRSGTMDRKIQGFDFLSLVGQSTQLAYASLADNVTLASTAVDVVSAGALVFTGSTRICVEFGCAGAYSTGGNTGVLVYLFDGASAVLLLGFGRAENVAVINPMTLRRYFTPSAGSHTYNIKALTNEDNDTSYLLGNDGDSYMPLYIRITTAPAA